MAENSLAGGFAAPAVNSAVAFRGIIMAMAEPGRIMPVSGGIPPRPMDSAAGVLALTLCDPTTPVGLMPSMDQPAIREWLTFHTGAPIIAPGEAEFVFGRFDEMADFTVFRQGTSEYPDRSATLVAAVASLENSGAVLRGPGIKESRALNLPDVTPFQANAALYPLGVDVVMVAGGDLVAIPRSTRVEVE